MKLWDENRNFWLLTQEEYLKLPNDSILETVDGEKVLKEFFSPNIFNELGYTNCGVIDPFDHQCKNYFFIFMLRR